MSETPETKQPNRSGKGASVFIYLAILFAAAFLLLLLAYFIQQRNNAAELDGLKDSLSFSSSSNEELAEENRKLQEEYAAAQAELAELEETVQALETQLEESRAQNEAQTEEWQETWADARDLEDKLGSWEDFYHLTELYRAGQYQECANFLIILSGSTYYITPEVGYTLVEDIYNQLVANGYLSPEDLLYDIIHLQ